MRRKLGSELTNRSSKCQSVIMLSPSSLPPDDEKKTLMVCFALILHEMVCCDAGQQKNSRSLSFY